MTAALVVALLTVGGAASAATPWTIDEFPILTPFALPNEIAAGPDGNLWFTERTGGIVGRITPDGVVTEFPIADPDPRPEGIAAGPDGNLWVALRNANAIARITTAGVMTFFPVPSTDAVPVDIDLGSDGGNLGLDVFAPGSPSSEPVDCATGASLGAGTVADGDLKFSGGRYAWTWSTQRRWTGTCRALTMDFAIGDGVAIRLLVRFI